MRRLPLLFGLLLTCAVAGCVSEGNLRVPSTDPVVLGAQRLQYDAHFLRELTTNFNAYDEQLAQLEQSQREVRRELAQTEITTEELRLAIQHLLDTLETIQQHLQQEVTSTAGGDELLTSQLAELNSRLTELEHRVTVAGRATFTPSASPEALSQSARGSQDHSATRSRPSLAASSPSHAPTRLYERGIQKYQQGDYDAAVAHFQEFLRDYPQVSLAGQVQYWLGETLYTQNQYEAAIVAFDAFIQKFPHDAKVPSALLKQGYAFMVLKEMSVAQFFLRQVQHKYPDSSEARQAEKALQQLTR